MKTNYLLLVGMVVVLASCSSAYRNGQTPDDVYYSPVPASETYVVKNNRNDRNSYANRNADTYGDYTQEREIRRAIRDPRYRSSISLSMGYGGYSPFGYNPYNYNPYGFNSFGNNYGFNSFGNNSYYGFGKGYYDPFGYNPYYNQNSHYNYNPYYPSYGYNPIYGGYYPPTNYYPVPGKTSSNRGARQYNLGSYTPRPSTAPRGIAPTKNGIFRPAPVAPVRTFESRKSPTTPVRQEKTGVGNVIRRVFTPSNDKTNTRPANRRVEKSNTPPVRRFDPPVRRSQPPVRRNNTPPVRNNTPPVRSNNTPPVRSTNNPPARTFDPSPALSSPAPSASSSSTPARESSSTPVRTFRNN